MFIITEYTLTCNEANAVVDYTDCTMPWTRIIEHKWFTFGENDDGVDIPNTIISREYSTEWNPGEKPYYPVNDEKSPDRYYAYEQLAKKKMFCLAEGWAHISIMIWIVL